MRCINVLLTYMGYFEDVMTVVVCDHSGHAWVL